MNFDKGLVVSVMQIQNINLKYQTGALYHILCILFIEECQEFVIDTISDICAARYLDVILQKAQR